MLLWLWKLTWRKCPDCGMRMCPKQIANKNWAWSEYKGKPICNQCINKRLLKIYPGAGRPSWVSVEKELLKLCIDELTNYEELIEDEGSELKSKAKPQIEEILKHA